MKIYKGLFFVFVFFLTIFLSVTQSHSTTWTIDSTPGAGGIISPFGYIYVQEGSNQSFIITPDLGYEITDVVVDSGSVGPVSSYTFSNVTADHSISASFTACSNPPLPVKLDWDGSYYNSIMDAYSMAVGIGLSDFTLLLMAGTFPEDDLYFGADASVTITGGHNCNFLSGGMLTQIQGTVTVAGGTVIPSNLVITSAPLCQPGDPNNFPGNDEICDGIDNNCDGVIDEGCLTDCTSCHASSQPDGYWYRRQVTGPGGDFGEVSHHVSDGSGMQSVTNNDCTVCHYQGQHQTLLDPPVLLNDPDLGIANVIIYDGSGGSIENFCLNCHDADSSIAYDSDGDPVDGSQPFSDDVTPVDIKTVWSGSSHDTGLTAEACLSCHGGPDITRSNLDYDQNVHGTYDPSILSNTVAGETVSIGYEETLCFACHDNDGPSATNIESMFNAFETMTSASGALLNTHHDILDWSQTYSGAVIECSDCHDIHAGHLINDPDPGDGVIPAGDARYTGASYTTDWCLDCHDNSFPALVTPPSNPMVNILTEWTDTRGAQHGANIASKNVNLRPGSGYSREDILNCEVCHVSGHGDEVGGNTYPNIAQLRAVIYSKDGTTPLMPDQSWDITNPYIVRVLNVASGNSDATTNGKAWCSTCHPNPMGGNKNSGCFDGNCHSHGQGSF